MFGVDDSTAALAFGNSNSFSFSVQQQPLWSRTSDGSNIFGISDSAAREYTRAAFGFEDINETAPFQRPVALVVGRSGNPTLVRATSPQRQHSAPL